jgi:trk system potassium uptake protein
MKTIIVGAGEVGFYLSEILSQRGFEVTVIESSPSQVRRVDDELDVRVLSGNGASAAMLERAGVRQAHFVIAVTSDDMTNIVCCSLSKALTPGVTTICRVHDATWADHSLINYQLHFGIDHLLNPEALCAVELAKQIRNPGRVAVENIARGRIEVQQLQISRASQYTGKPLKQIHLPRDVRVASITKPNRPFEVATADSMLEVGDLVTLFGLPECMAAIKPLLDPSSKLTPSRIVIFGGTEIAISLVRLLNNNRYKIRIFEGDAQLCQNLAERLPEVTVIRGDATSRRLLEEEQIGSCDYFVACSKRDEDNVMTGIQAAKMGARHVQLVVNRTDYEPILSDLSASIGVELMVSPRVAMAAELLRLVDAEPATEVSTLSEAGAVILEVRVSNR